MSFVFVPPAGADPLTLAAIPATVYVGQAVPLTATGGTPPYAFTVDGQPVMSPWTPAAVGAVTVAVTDAGGETRTQAVAAAGTTYSLPLTVTEGTRTVGETEYLRADQHAGKSFAFTVVDVDGAAVSLAGKTVTLRIYRPGTSSPLHSIGASVGGNVATVAMTDTHTAVADYFGADLKNDTDDVRLASFPLEIVPGSRN